MPRRAGATACRSSRVGDRLRRARGAGSPPSFAAPSPSGAPPFLPPRYSRARGRAADLVARLRGLVPDILRALMRAGPRISVGLPQLLPDRPLDVVRRFGVRAEELGFARLWTLDSVPGSATSRVPLLDGLHVLTTAAAVTG